MSGSVPRGPGAHVARHRDAEPGPGAHVARHRDAERRRGPFTDGADSPVRRIFGA
ncbi:hypothetical protein [Micromonospora rubida]|uniref:hypothetical protein n=1 Tax=Micromonospora rubida TaxID=2697657 RepID=UPI001376D36B|nr:hypothetical protein [Micromonospora rubida]NBE83763.1 hypothetical protein [Micromonospora rubida]